MNPSDQKLPEPGIAQAPTTQPDLAAIAGVPRDQSDQAKKDMERDSDLEYPQGGDTSDETATGKTLAKGSVGSSGEGDSADPSSLNRDPSQDDRDDKR